MTVKIPRSLRILARRLGAEPVELSREILEEVGSLEPPEAALVFEAGLERVLGLGLHAEYMARMILEQLGGGGFRLAEVSWVEGFEGVVLVFYEEGGDAVLEVYVQRDGVYVVYAVPVFEEAEQDAARTLEQAILAVDRESATARRLVEHLSRVEGSELSIEPEADGETSLVITIHVPSMGDAPPLAMVEELASEILGEARRMQAGPRRG